MTDIITVLHPAIEQLKGNAPRLAVRAPALAGKRLALLDNGKLNGDVVLVAVGERLKKLGVAEVAAWRKRHAGESGDAVIAKLMTWKPDIALTALGD